ncbi:Putative sugar phosphate transporter domain-containing protein [Septoria linicola]|uniref:Sugar phosphate transporter domain-containing protein n=1 Tax=Septoria linicola TaxID=215465 RepID=A0A9Q9ENH4_9PEZI|nr:Putative sugar phosphate transporter domain-containing protein [Septoria linicola]
MANSTHGHSRQRSGSLLFSQSTKHNATSSSRPPPIPVDGGGLGETKVPSDSDQSTDMELSSILSSDDDDDDYDDDEETGLTQPERKRRRRRRKLTHSDPSTRISGEALLAEETGIAKTALIRKIIVNGLLILLWYTFSISISVYNKWMFSAENLDFHFPLFTTSIHMLVQFTLASLVIILFPRFRPGRDRNGHVIQDEELDDREGEEHRYERVRGRQDSQQTTTRKQKPLMTRSFYLSRITPCGGATALDIGLGNFSLRFISLTFFTMCKSSVLAFVLLFAFIFKLEKPTWRLCGIIGLMTVGVILMVSGEAAFNALGFILVMTASLCSGFRWSLTQILLLRNKATSNPFSSIFFLTPVMFIVLFLLALPIEGPGAVLQGLGELVEAKGHVLGALIILFPGCLAFMMVAAEFALLQRTSVVTLSVCGIFKEVLTISAASFTFGDELSPINVSGLIVTIASIAGYNWLKYSKMSRDAKKEAHAIVASEVDSPDKPRSSIEEAEQFALGRDSMASEAGGLMRDSLHLTTEYDRGGGTQRHENSKSPTKRPEDLE